MPPKIFCGRRHCHIDIQIMPPKIFSIESSHSVHLTHQVRMVGRFYGGSPDLIMEGMPFYKISRSIVEAYLKVNRMQISCWTLKLRTTMLCTQDIYCRYVQGI